jgi:hypothetical protein
MRLEKVGTQLLKSKRRSINPIGKVILEEKARNDLPIVQDKASFFKEAKE